jgi:[acyl-carrier-protein] S-malonyltransferase
MSSNIHILCPGQGAQTVGMGRDLYHGSAAAKAVFDQCDVAAVCFDGPAERLNQTDVSQPALYVTGVASFRAAVEAGAFDTSAVAVYAGLSLGEYTALHLAGVFPFETGLHLVSQRGKFMQEAAVATPSGMVAIIGGDEETVSKVCQEAKQGDVLVLANFNAPGQIVVSGDKAACDRAVGVAEAAGLRALPLAVAGAFHSPLMQSAADRMKVELDAVPFNKPAATVYSNVTGKPHEDVQSIKRLLVEQIVQPVRWQETMIVLAAAAGARFIELSPGRTLAGLVKRINRRLAVEENGGWKGRVGP